MAQTVGVLRAKYLNCRIRTSTFRDDEHGKRFIEFTGIVQSIRRYSDGYRMELASVLSEHDELPETFVLLVNPAAARNLEIIGTPLEEVE